MIRKSTCLTIPFLLLINANNLFAEQTEKTLTLQSDNFEHIEFKRIKASQHHFEAQQLRIDVDNSASFLMKAFDTVRRIRHVSFEWQSTGKPAIKDASHEEQRSGDDAVFKVGLLLKSEDSLFNPFLPSWMKRVEELLNFPSQNMIYLIADSKHQPGQQWANPYNERITMIAVESKTGTQGWTSSSYNFETPVEVVAIWLMSDGDNTDSRFTASIRNIRLE